MHLSAAALGAAAELANGSSHGQIEAMEIYKAVIPQYLLTSQKLDFLCFTEGLFKLAEKYVPDACAEDKALWCGCVRLSALCAQRARACCCVASERRRLQARRDVRLIDGATGWPTSETASRFAAGQRVLRLMAAHGMQGRCETCRSGLSSTDKAKVQFLVRQRTLLQCTTAMSLRRNWRTISKTSARTVFTQLFVVVTRFCR